MIRVTDAKEVGVGNPSEETCCHPNQIVKRTGPNLLLPWCLSIDLEKEFSEYLSGAEKKAAKSRLFFQITIEKL